MEKILYDYHIAQAMSEVTSYDPSKTTDARRYELQEAVLRKHGITQAEFDSSMVFYCSDLDRMNRIYHHISIRMDRDAEALGASLTSTDMYAGLTAEGDTANVWSGRPLFVVRNRSGENLQSWQMPCDSTWLAGDNLLFRFHSQTYAREGYHTVYVTMVVNYDNDSVRARTLLFNARANDEIRIDNPKGWVAKSVSGFFYLPADDDPQRFCINIINDVSLIRFHRSQAWRDRLLKPDSLATDSLQSDSLAHLGPARSAGAITSDSLEHRRSPMEFRNQQEVEQKINVVKEKPYQIRQRKKTQQRRRTR